MFQYKTDMIKYAVLSDRYHYYCHNAAIYKTPISKTKVFQYAKREPILRLSYEARSCVDSQISFFQIFKVAINYSNSILTIISDCSRADKSTLVPVFLSATSPLPSYFRTPN